MKGIDMKETYYAFWILFCLFCFLQCLYVIVHVKGLES